MKRLLVLVTLAAALLSAVPSVSASSSLTFTSSLQASWGKTVSAADKALADRLKKQRIEFDALRSREETLDETIRAMQDANRNAEDAVRQAVRKLNGDRLVRLQADADAARKRHQPLFDEYRELNRQIALARPLKNKTVNALLKLRKDALQLAVDAARSDIRRKDAALREVRTETTALGKRVRDALAGVAPLERRIQSERAAIRQTSGKRTPEWKDFSAAVKKGQARAAADSLDQLVKTTRLITERQQRIRALETEIAAVISRAKAMLP